MKKKNILLLIITVMIVFSTINVFAASCQEVIGAELMEKIRNNVFKPIKIIAPVLLLVFTTIDFAKAVFSDNKDGINKALNNFLKRAIATLVVFFAPDIIELIISFINSRNMDACLNLGK